MNYCAIAYRSFLASGFSMVFLKTDLESENHAGFLSSF